MKRIFFSALLITLLVAFFLPLSVLAAGLRDSKVVFGGQFTLREGEVLEGDLVLFGGEAELQKGSTVTGNIALLGGKLSCLGEVRGDIVGFGGEITLQPTAEVAGDVILYGSSYQQREGAQVGTVLRYESVRPFAAVYPLRIELPNLEGLTKGWMKLGGFLFRVFAWAALAILCGLVFPKPMERIANVVHSQAIVAATVGLVSIVVVVVGSVLLAVTLIFLPISFLAFILVILGWFLGILAIGLETGRRLTEWFKQNWSLPIMAGVGTFVLVLVVNGVAALIPCVGWIIPFSVGVVGFGAVMMTQFGFREVV